MDLLVLVVVMGYLDVEHCEVHKFNSPHWLFIISSYREEARGV